MIKQAPSLGRMLAMAVFTLSVFGLLMFLWLAFGGSIPLNPQSYRFTVHVEEAATLAQEADVRIAGVNVGKVKSKELDRKDARTIVEVEIDEAYAPIPKDSRAILRQKTLLGETYLEVAPGDPRRGLLDDGERLANSQVEETVELDEIFTAFDPETRKAFQDWVKELSGVIEGGRSQDLNDAFGNFEGFAVDGATLLAKLDEQGLAVKRLVRNTGEVFGAINERRGALRELVVNSKRTFEATASRDEALAETFRVFPAFLDESKATLARLERFSADTRPLVNDLKAPADDLGPTVRDLGDLAPDLERLFSDLDPLIRAGDRGVPALERTLEGAEPLAEGLHTFFPELNPILAYFNYHQSTIAGFISNGASDLSVGLRHRAERPDPDRPDRRALGRGLPLRRGPARLRARQRVPGAQRAQPRAPARHHRELQLPGRSPARPQRRHQGGRGQRRQARALRDRAEVALRRAPVPGPGAGRSAASPAAAGVPGQPAGERPESRRLTRARIPCAGAEAKPAPKWVLQRNASSLRHVHAPGRTFESPQKSANHPPLICRR